MPHRIAARRRQECLVCCLLLCVIDVVVVMVFFANKLRAVVAVCCWAKYYRYSHRTNRQEAPSVTHHCNCCGTLEKPASYVHRSFLHAIVIMISLFRLFSISTKSRLTHQI